MRRVFLALSLFAAPLVLAATPVAHAAGPHMSIRYYKGNTLSNGGTLHVGGTTTGIPFHFFLIIDSDGDSPLTIDSVTLPAGFSLYNPFATPTSPIAPGATASLWIQCDASLAIATGSLVIDAAGSANDITATLTCESHDFLFPGMMVTTDAGAPVANGGSLTVNPGSTETLWIYNEGVSDATELMFLAPTASPATIDMMDYYVGDDVVAYAGIPVYFWVACRDTSQQPVTGDFTISIPVSSWEDYYTFTLHCAVTDGGSLGNVPTGSGLTMWGSAIAVLLMAAGASLWLTSRRSASAA